MTPILTSKDVMALFPTLTYRQLDLWARQGLLGGDAEEVGPGSGRGRSYTPSQVARLGAVVAMTGAGFTLEAAVKAASWAVDLDPKPLTWREAISR